MSFKYQYYKALGICPYCRQRKPESGKTMCRECLDKIAARRGKQTHPERKVMANKKWTLCNEDCFNCTYKDCIKP